MTRGPSTWISIAFIFLVVSCAGRGDAGAATATAIAPPAQGTYAARLGVTRTEDGWSAARASFSTAAEALAAAHAEGSHKPLGISFCGFDLWEHTSINGYKSIALVKEMSEAFQISHFPLQGVYDLLSARLVDLERPMGSFLEVVETTPKGNGFLHLFGPTLKEILKTRFYDSHADGMDYFDGLAVSPEILKLHERMKGISFSSFYRDDYSLKIAYDWKEPGMVRVYGAALWYVDCIADYKEKPLYEDRIDNYYRFSVSTGIFEYLPALSDDELHARGD